MTGDLFNPNLFRPPAGELTKPASGPLTVSQVTAMVKRAIEEALPSTLHVIGEISNFKQHASGHLYLTLKDGLSELSCVMWRSAAAKLKFAPTDGLEVIATGNVEVFERAGRYQLHIRKLQPQGMGALELAFRQLCEKLEEEGLFDERHKQPLPAYPTRIVLVTSSTGAAVADMLRTIEQRYPCVHIFVYPVRVQGAGAAQQITAAIRRVNANRAQLGGVDVMIVGRGGGSLEDLWAFNEEIVARAIYASRIPIISAVGHEVDVSIADLVADVRAATPTAAAQLVVPVLAEVLADLDLLRARMIRALQSRLDLLQTRLAGALQRSWYRQPVAILHRREQHVDELFSRMQRRLTHRLHTARRALDMLDPILQRIAPHAYLARTSVRLRDAEHRLRWSAARRLVQAERAVGDQAQRLERTGPATRIPRQIEQVRRLAELLPASMRHRLSLMGEQVHGQRERLAAMGYTSVLGRGFSITRIKKGRRVLRSMNELEDHVRLITELADGEFESRVVNLKQLELFDSS